MPTYWECDRCTACCRWPGQVRLTDADVTRIATHLHLTEDEFIQGHTRLDAQRSGLALRDHADGSCGFLDARGNCRIQPVKPRQCSDFPNRWNFPGFETICRARPVEVSAEEWERRTQSPPEPFVERRRDPPTVPEAPEMGAGNPGPPDPSVTGVTAGGPPGWCSS